MAKAKTTPNLPVAAQAARTAMKLGPSQKAAIIVVLLGPEAAKPLVTHLQDRHLQQLLLAYTNLKQIPRDVMLGAVAEFIAQLNRSAGGLRGGQDRALALAESLMDTDRARTLLGERPLPQIETNAPVWPALSEKKPAELVTYLNTLPAEIVSTILSKLSTDKVGETLPLLDDKLSTETAVILARKNEISAATEQAVGEMVRHEFLLVSQVDETAAAAKFMGEVMSILPKNKRDALLGDIEKSDAKQAERIKANMMTFEDIPQRLPPTAIPIVLREINPELLIKALKAGGAAFPDVTEFIFANISQRMAGQYKEQTEELAELTSKEADAAITGFMGALSKAEKSGAITLIKPKKKEGAEPEN